MTKLFLHDGRGGHIRTEVADDASVIEISVREPGVEITTFKPDGSHATLELGRTLVPIYHEPRPTPERYRGEAGLERALVDMLTWALTEPSVEEIRGSLAGLQGIQEGATALKNRLADLQGRGLVRSRKFGDSNDLVYSITEAGSEEATSRPPRR